MEPRIDYRTVAPDGFAALVNLKSAVERCRYRSLALAVKLDSQAMKGGALLQRGSSLCVRERISPEKAEARQNRSMKEALVEHFRSPSHIRSGRGYAA